MKNKTIIGGLAIALAAIMWGFDGVVLTPRLFNLDVSFVVFVLHAIPFILMNLFLFKQYKQLKRFTKNDVLIFTLIAATGGSIGTLAIVKALFLVNFQHLSIVILLQKLQPIFAIALAAILLKEKITKNFIIWALVAIAAGYTLTFGLHLPHMSSGINTVSAALYALLAAFCFGSSTVFSKMVLAKYNFKTVTFYRYGFTSIIMLLIVLSLGKMTQFNVTTQQNWLFFIIIALTTGSGAILLYYYGLNQVKAIASIIVELLFPISAIIFDYIINDSLLSPIQWISAAIMVFSIIRLNKKIVVQQ
ncbi:MAG: EamA family transporter [Salinivirgaceae bacterium]|nr:EamA family transporter [Salinivirgaceae bacterium]